MGQEKRWLEPRVFFEYRRHAQKARTGCREKLIIRSRSATNPRDGVSSLLTSWLSCSVFRDDPNSLSVFFSASLPRHLGFGRSGFAAGWGERAGWVVRTGV